MYTRTSNHLAKLIEDATVRNLPAHGLDFLARHEQCLTDVMGPDALPGSVGSVDPRELLRAYSRRLGMKFNPRCYLQLGREDNFEIWSLDMKFLGTGNQLIRRLSYTIQDLLEKNWDELFDRDPEAQQKITAAVGRLATGETYVEDIAPLHFVTERQAGRRRAYVAVKSGSLATDIVTGQVVGFVGITTIQDHPAFEN